MAPYLPKCIFDCISWNCIVSPIFSNLGSTSRSYWNGGCLLLRISGINGDVSMHQPCFLLAHSKKLSSCFATANTCASTPVRLTSSLHCRQKALLRSREVVGIGHNFRAHFLRRARHYLAVTCKPESKTIRALVLVKLVAASVREATQNILGDLCKPYISFICPYTQFTYMHNVINKYSDRTTVKRRKMAICSRHRTVRTPDFLSTAWLRYGPHPYNTVFCTAFAVYSAVGALRAILSEASDFV